ncbi:Fatty acid oxidation complex subunit alpha [Apiospora marii]|uniref:Fatty acid oxidation complex subunit alpha n=1 Tax=Apiospora marii TaxID=335849 RepID=A0ABR1RGS4_9PEZI
MEAPITRSQASTSGTKRPRSRSASASGEDRPAPALRAEPAAAAAAATATGSEIVVAAPPTQAEASEPDADVEVQVNHNLPERRYDIDPDGDLLLAIGEECPSATPATFRVDSRALARASAVFRQMLHGGFAEARRPGRGGGDWVVRLPEDSPNTFYILLSIFHTQFDKVPQDELKGSRIQLIYDLTITTDKYDLTHCVRPWAALWSALRLQQVTELNNRKQPGAHNASTYVGLQKCLWITWELGNLAEFERIIVELAWCSRLDVDNGSLWSPVTAHGTKGVLFNETFEPEEAFETIHATRQKAVSRLLTPLLAWVEALIPDAHEPRGGSDTSNLDAMLGATLRAMKKYRLWPLPNRDTYAGSVYQLVAALRAVSDSLSNDGHFSQLTIKMSDLGRDVDGILRDKVDNNLRPVLAACQVEHVEARGRRTGLFKPAAAAK